MKKKLFRSLIFVQQSQTNGYGVFAGQSFNKENKIEECYMILSHGGDKVLEDYYFDVNGKSAVFTGFGSIYNHSTKPNAYFTIDVRKRLATLRALRRIHEGEEIFISYGRFWFNSRSLKPI
ncbi:MAG TPA: SET domain-containing protein-lysine N-methyltransferase [Gammaproteobacteria bacterium]|jgi:SET domain-containing protein|nr:SET domain-containing protein-lysine N-methyltransferase [Gammaproteobacteria bacterium]